VIEVVDGELILPGQPKTIRTEDLPRQNSFELIDKDRKTKRHNLGSSRRGIGRAPVRSDSPPNRFPADLQKRSNKSAKSSKDEGKTQADPPDNHQPSPHKHDKAHNAHTETRSYPASRSGTPHIVRIRQRYPPQLPGFVPLL
jgi:hypothetical protein